jgi:3-methyladenine DNA glycosylase AlkC
MAETLKAGFGPEVVLRLAAAISAVHPEFDRRGFETDALAGFDALELMARGQCLADALRRHLPGDYGVALDILMRSCATTPPPATSSAMASFFWLPHTLFVARHGLAEAEFGRSMAALHALTQRFTGEFAIRAFLERYPQRTLAVLGEWAGDPMASVRRLVSEGTRPRLPWAAQLRAFRKDPAPVLPLLERLRDDSSEDVRRSVANHLNDIGKDHPELLLEICKRWLIDAPIERRRLVAHALRSLTRSGDERALQLLGFGTRARVRIEQARIEPPAPRIGESVQIRFEIVGEARETQRLRLDLRIGYRKADGSARPRSFALKTLALERQARQVVMRRISLAQLSTRTHYPGEHAVELVLNGEAWPLGTFSLRPAVPRASAP